MDPRLAAHFQRHGALVYRRALQLLGNAADAEEATQEVFIRASEALGRFDAQAKVSTWLYRITTNYCLNTLRDQARRRVLLAERGEEVAPATVPYDLPQMIALRRLLAEADPMEAAAAVAVYVDGMSHAEAAEALQVSKRTVGNLCERFTTWAARRLRETS